MPKRINSAIESAQGDISGNTVEVTVPYELAGITPKGRARFSIRESDGPFNDESYFPEVFL